MDFFSIMVIQELTSAHSGEYTCRATNDFGSVTHSAQLLVKGIPDLQSLGKFNKGLDSLTFIAVFPHRVTDVGMEGPEYFSVSWSHVASAMLCEGTTIT